ILITAILLPFTALHAWAGDSTGQSPLIVDAAYGADAMKRNAIVWDTRSAAQYKEGHLPGAVNVGDVGVVLRDENTEDYLPLERLEKILGSAGIDPAREVIVYGYKGNPYVYFALV